MQVLDLSNNDISEIKGLETLTNLEKLYLGNNPIYKNLKNVIANKKKLSKMTGEEREKAGVNPKVWETVVNSRFILFKQPPKISKSPKTKTKQKNTGSERCCINCICELILGIIFALIIYLLTGNWKLF